MKHTNRHVVVVQFTFDDDDRRIVKLQHLALGPHTVPADFMALTRVSALVGAQLHGDAASSSTNRQRRPRLIHNACLCMHAAEFTQVERTLFSLDALLASHTTEKWFVHISLDISLSTIVSASDVVVHMLKKSGWRRLSVFSVHCDVNQDVTRQKSLYILIVLTDTRCRD